MLRCLKLGSFVLHCMHKPNRDEQTLALSQHPLGTFADRWFLPGKKTPGNDDFHFIGARSDRAVYQGVVLEDLVGDRPPAHPSPLLRASRGLR